MICTKQKYRSPQKTWGGKSYLARWIIEWMPEFDAQTEFVETHCGGANVFWNLPKCRRETLIDTNEYVINLYRVLQDPGSFGEFKDIVSRLQYTESVFQMAQAMDHGAPRGIAAPNVDSAVFYMVRNRFSSQGLGKRFAWSERKRGKIPLPGDVNAWRTFKLELDKWHARLQGVALYNDDSINLIQQLANANCVLYVDPPYPHDTRVSKRAYGKHEMTPEQHLALLELLIASPAKGIFISTYWNKLYESVLRPAGFDHVIKDIANHSARGKTKQIKQEVLWMRF